MRLSLQMEHGKRPIGKERAKKLAESLKRFVAIGLGLAIMPRVAVVNEVRAGQMIAVPIHGLPVREIRLVERTEKRRSAATAFLQLWRA